MTTNVRNDTPTPAAGQRPTNLAEAIDLLTKQQHYDGELLQFVGDLIGEYPHLVMEKVITMRSDSIRQALREYRGEV